MSITLLDRAHESPGRHVHTAQADELVALVFNKVRTHDPPPQNECQDAECRVTIGDTPFAMVFALNNRPFTTPFLPVRAAEQIWITTSSPRSHCVSILPR